MVCLREKPRIVRAGVLVGRPGRAVALLVLVHTQQAEQHIIRPRVFGMHLKNGALEILHHIALPVGVRDFLYRLTQRVALLVQAAVLVPLGEKAPADGVPRRREKAAVVLRRHAIHRKGGDRQEEHSYGTIISALDLNFCITFTPSSIGLWKGPAMLSCVLSS